MGNSSGEVVANAISALSAAGVSLADPMAGLVAAGVQPLVAAGLSAVGDRIARWRLANVAEAFQVAANDAEMTPEAFAQAVVRDQRHSEFFTLAMQIVQNMGMENKRRALAAALAAAITGEDSRLDDEFLFVRALDDLQEPHIRLLHLICVARAGDGQMAGTQVTGGWTTESLGAADPGLADALAPLLSTLLAHGLVVNPHTWDNLAKNGIYNPAARGQHMLERLQLPMR